MAQAFEIGDRIKLEKTCCAFNAGITGTIWKIDESNHPYQVTWDDSEYSPYAHWSGSYFARLATLECPECGGPFALDPDDLHYLCPSCRQLVAA